MSQTWNDDKLIQSRMQSEQSSAEKLLAASPYTESDDAKKALLEMLLYIYFLEGVKFPFSFFITWTINNAYNNSIQGFSKLLKLIAHDELTVHVITGREVLNLLRSDSKQGFKHLFDSGWFIPVILYAGTCSCCISRNGKCCWFTQR